MSAISCEWLDGLLDGDYDFTVYSRKNARAELSRLRAAASEADTLRSTVAEQARQIEAYKYIFDGESDTEEKLEDALDAIDEARELLEGWVESFSEVPPIDHVIRQVRAWLAANAPTPAPEAEQERAASTVHCSQCGCFCAAEQVDSFGVCEVCNSYD